MALLVVGVLVALAFSISWSVQGTYGVTISVKHEGGAEIQRVMWEFLPLPDRKSATEPVLVNPAIVGTFVVPVPFTYNRGLFGNKWSYRQREAMLLIVTLADGHEIRDEIALPKQQPMTVEVVAGSFPFTVQVSSKDQPIHRITWRLRSGTEPIGPAVSAAPPEFTMQVPFVENRYSDGKVEYLQPQGAVLSFEFAGGAKVLGQMGLPKRGQPNRIEMNISGTTSAATTAPVAPATTP
jgi:hypothetical protein